MWFVGFAWDWVCKRLVCAPVNPSGYLEKNHAIAFNNNFVTLQFQYPHDGVVSSLTSIPVTTRHVQPSKQNAHDRTLKQNLFMKPVHQ
eukprot:3255815-Amphidinium_carterae.1